MVAVLKPNSLSEVMEHRSDIKNILEWVHKNFMAWFLQEVSKKRVIKVIFILSCSPQGGHSMRKRGNSVFCTISVRGWEHLNAWVSFLSYISSVCYTFNPHIDLFCHMICKQCHYGHVGTLHSSLILSKKKLAHHSVIWFNCSETCREFGKEGIRPVASVSSATNLVH